MTTATVLMLLQMASQLLVSASAPEVTPAVRESAISIVNYVVVLAMDEIKRMESSNLGGINPPEAPLGVQSDFSDNSTTKPAKNPKFVGNPKVFRNYFGTAGDWNLEVSLKFTDAPFAGYICKDFSEKEIARNNRLPSDRQSVSFRIPHDPFLQWNSTYNCTFFLQDWAEEEQTNINSSPIKNLTVTKDFSFTTPIKPF